MKTDFLLVGKTTDKHLQTLIDDYVSRVGHYMPFSMITIPATKSRKTLSEEQQCKIEGTQILEKVSPNDTLVLFDEHGKEYTSMELASWLQSQRMNSRRLVLAIGGPYGFSQEVYKRANEMISLSRLTLSHQMVRLFAVEQIYRACTIINGEPYHHE